VPKIHDLPPDGIHAFICPGCGRCHAPDERWTFNGDYEKPTFSPSILVKTGHYPKPEDICHSFVTDGMIQFLSDCTHELAGQTIEIPDWDDW